MKTIILLSMIAFNNVAHACKMTSLHASQLKIAAATEYVVSKHTLAEQSLMVINSVRNNSLGETIVQVQFNYETPSIVEHILAVNFNADCSTVVDEVPLIFP